MTKNKNMVFIYFFMKTSEKIKRLVGYRFQELFPNPKKLGWVHLVVFTHPESAFGVQQYEYGDRENV